ncbi:hypothetical protein ACFV9P_33700 [Streptomyces sp. NPDC059892]|uniref:hypothetical protein n=1 Tax=Streptomyces sp. NPDC059892 TaxID=3346989 RepID=UPI003649A924
MVTLIGDEPYLPYDRPPLSKQVLTGQWQPDRLALRPQADLDALRLDLRLGVPAAGLDLAGRTVALADGTRVPFAPEGHPDALRGPGRRDRCPLPPSAGL